MTRRNRLVVLSILLLALVAFAFWLLGGEPPAAAGPRPVSQQPGEPAPTLQAEQAPLTSAERTELPATPAPAVTADPKLAHVRGRCVDEALQALAGCTVKLGGWGGNSNRMAMQGKVEWKDPEPIVTGNDGRFDFAFAPPSGMQFALDAQAEGRVPRTGRWGTIAEAQIIDLGDVAMLRGFKVRGRVADEQGVSVSRVSVGLESLPLPLAENMGANNVRHGTSGENGEFSVATPIPPGNWPIDCQGDGIRLVAPDRITVGEHGAEFVTVTVRHMPSIEGIVVDELGAPVERVSVEAELNRSGRMASAWSKKDGTFRIFAVDAEPKPVRLVVDDPGPCEPSWRDERLWEWGSRDVRITLKHALSFELTVVERQSGVPVTQYSVSCYRTPVSSSLQSDLRLSDEHPEGRVTVDRVWRGKNVLQVMPRDQALVPSAKIEFEVGDGPVAPIRVELERLQPAVARVTDASGKPVAGAKVEVIQKGTQPFDATAFAQDSRQGSSGFSSDSKHRFHELIASGLTGTDGRVQVYMSRALEGLVVRVTGAHPPAIVDPAVFVPDQDLVVVVPEGGGIIGKVRLQGFDPAQIAVLVQPASGEPRRAPQGEGALQGDGSFAARGLAPGSYRLQLLYAVRYRTDHGSSGGNGMPLDVKIPDVLVQAGRDTEVDIDATVLPAAVVRGRLLLDGVVPPAARAFLRLESGRMFGQFTPDADGVFTATGLVPGTWRGGLVVGDFLAGEGDRILTDDTFVLTAGQELTRDFLFTRRRLTITILQPGGAAAAALQLRVSDGKVFHKQLATDGKGMLVIDPAPLGRINLQPTGLPAPGGRLEPVEFPAGRSEHAVTLTLAVPPNK